MKYYSYEMYKKDVHTLIALCKDESFDTIVGISRGGLALAQSLAYALDVRDVQTVQCELYDQQKKRQRATIQEAIVLKPKSKVLLVDDIVDSGETLEVIMEHLQNKFVDVTWFSCSLFYKQDALCKPTFWVQSADEWIDFFWERDFTSCAL